MSGRTFQECGLLQKQRFLFFFIKEVATCDKMYWKYECVFGGGLVNIKSCYGNTFSVSILITQNDNHVEVLKEKLRLLKIEFERIKDNLIRGGEKYDKCWPNSLIELLLYTREGQDIANEFVQLLEDQKTLTLLDQVNFPQILIMLCAFCS